MEGEEYESAEEPAKTVGSVMANHIGKGLYLNPNNHNKDICLEYILGPPQGTRQI